MRGRPIMLALLAGALAASPAGAAVTATPPYQSGQCGYIQGNDSANQFFPPGAQPGESSGSGTATPGTGRMEIHAFARDTLPATVFLPQPQTVGPYTVPGVNHPGGEVPGYPVSGSVGPFTVGPFQVGPFQVPAVTVGPYPIGPYQLPGVNTPPFSVGPYSFGPYTVVEVGTQTTGVPCILEHRIATPTGGPKTVTVTIDSVSPLTTSAAGTGIVLSPLVNKFEARADVYLAMFSFPCAIGSVCAYNDQVPCQSCATPTFNLVHNYLNGGLPGAATYTISASINATAGGYVYVQPQLVGIAWAGGNGSARVDASLRVASITISP